MKGSYSYAAEWQNLKARGARVRERLRGSRCGLQGCRGPADRSRRDAAEAAMTSGLRKTIVRQFGRPTGLVGRLVGLVMAMRYSNRERNRRTIELLDIQPDDRVLEIGFGPGLAIEMAARLARSGCVVGSRSLGGHAPSSFPQEPSRD